MLKQKDVKCSKCNKYFKNNLSLSLHLKRAHNLSYKEECIKKNKTCAYCKQKMSEYRKTYCSFKCRVEGQKIIKKNDITNVQAGLTSKSYQVKTAKILMRCKLCNRDFLDIKNSSGALTRHVRTKHNIDNWKECFEIIENKSPIKYNFLKCPLCDWKTIDINNRSGQLTIHFMKVHKMTESDILEKSPNFNCKTKIKKKMKYYKFLNENENHRIKCQICGQIMKKIMFSHLKKHNITEQEYRKKFNVKTLWSHQLLERQKELSYDTWINNKDNAKYISRAEEELRQFIEKQEIKIKSNCRNIIHGELDIFCVEKNIAFEYNGLFWHCERYKDKFYHLNKLNQCEEKNIRLIQIFEDEWINKRNIVENRVIHILGLNKNKKIYPKNCEVKEISPKEKNEFLEKYHIQGKDNSSARLGAFVDNILVSCMTFSKLRVFMGRKHRNNKDEYELTRFANCFEYNCVGFAGKLLKEFIRRYKPIKIISYADRRWTYRINMYEKIGFTKVKNTSPGYWYIDMESRIPKRIHRYGFTKYRLKELGFDENLSEEEITQSMGFLRIWDCGNIKYEINIEDKV